MRAFLLKPKHNKYRIKINKIKYTLTDSLQNEFQNDGVTVNILYEFSIIFFGHGLSTICISIFDENTFSTVYFCHLITIIRKK